MDPEELIGNTGTLAVEDDAGLEGALNLAQEDIDTEADNANQNDQQEEGEVDVSTILPTFHLAVYNGDIEAVAGFIESGADIEEKTVDDLTVLHLSCAKGHIQIAKLLIEKGANIEAQCIGDRTALHLAAEAGHVEIVSLLIEAGADIESKNKYGCTPLHAASYKSGECHAEVVRLLIEHGANIEARERYGHTPLYCALLFGNAAIMQLLIDHGANIEARDDLNNYTPLYSAALNGRIESMKVLINNGADIENRDENGHTPLHSAARLLQANDDGTGLVGLLIEHGANIEAQDRFGNTPLHTAATSERTEIMRLLIERGVDIDVVNGDGETPFNRAALEYGRTEAAKLLVEMGADLNIQQNRRSPLYILLNMFTEQELEGFVNQGADFFDLENLPHHVSIVLCMLQSGRYIDFEKVEEEINNAENAEEYLLHLVRKQALAKLQEYSDMCFMAPIK